MDRENREFYQQQRLHEDRQVEAKKRLREKLKQFEIIKSIKKIEDNEITILSRFIVIIAIVADVFGLIPFVGNITGIFFGVILIVLYFFDDLGRGVVGNLSRRQVRRWFLRIFIYGIEVLFPPLSWLPLFTIEALIGYNLKKRGYYKKIEKAQKIINKFN